MKFSHEGEEKIVLFYSYMQLYTMFPGGWGVKMDGQWYSGCTLVFEGKAEMGD